MTDRQDIRECFEPRPGCVYAVADYSQLELFALAQVCLDLKLPFHDLADALNSGIDPHTSMAAEILGITYEEACKRREDKSDKEFFMARQAGKSGNFGLACGLGPPKLVEYARKTYDTIIPLDDEPGALDSNPKGRLGAKSIKRIWFQRWREMPFFFEHVNALMHNSDGLGAVEIPRTHMLRSGLIFTETANTYYQGLGAAAAKRALWLVSRACYVEPQSPLYCSRICNFVHDEIILETADAPGAHDVAMELARLMREGAREMMPDCVPGVDPLLCRFWSKSAKAMHNKEGRLVPWPAA